MPADGNPQFTVNFLPPKGAEMSISDSIESTAGINASYARQQAIRCVLMRAGTSKGLFLHAQDLPAQGLERDAVLLRLMGSPDHSQVDGLGGSRPVTSKIAIVAPSERDDADVDYTFVQVGLTTPTVVYTGNCGNISSGVGPFAIDEGLVHGEVDGSVRVRIFNTNTERLLTADVPVRDGQAVVDGDFEIAGVPGAGAEIVLNWADTVGATTGRLLPTGKNLESVELTDGRSARVTLCDAANPFVWIEAASIGLDGDALQRVLDPLAHDSLEPLLTTVDEIRRKAAVRFGFCQDWTTADLDSPGFPIPGLVAPASTYTTLHGRDVPSSAADLRALVIFMGRLHDSIPGTGSICLAAAASVPGSVANRLLTDRDPGLIRIGQPSGVTPVHVDFVQTDSDPGIEFNRLAISRTARRLMAGWAYIPHACTSQF
jgi:2-methylaconitate cis-trans-isomerase PrpF